MRILWLAPWFRTLAAAWAEGLRALGHEVVVASTDMHFDPPELAPGDILFTNLWRTPRGLQEMRSARRAISDFAPDVVISEVMRDPRYPLLIPRGVPLVVTTHDAVAHDEANRTPLMRREIGRWLIRRAQAEVFFSDAVRRRLGDRGHPTFVIPLISEMREEDAPGLVPAADRHNFYVVGRLSTYKNIPLIIDAYRRHQKSPGYRGDRLVLIGGGDPGCPVPADVEWFDERFRFADVAPRLASGKASICMYTAGSQSGVQVMSMQCGVACLVSDVGGLASYLPAGETPLGPDDAEGLAARLDQLADPETAARAGVLARRRYESDHSLTVTSRSWEALLREVADDPSPHVAPDHV